MQGEMPKGGFAFPFQLGLGGQQTIHPGLSKRQWYAGQALSAVRPGDFESENYAASWCFQLADAMIAHEAKEQEVK